MPQLTWGTYSSEIHKNRKQNGDATDLGSNSNSKSYCLMDIEFSVWKGNKVLKMNGHNGCTTMQIYLMPLNCTLKNG